MIRTNNLVARVVGLGIAASALSACAQPTEGVAAESWREGIARNPAPTQGCFHASYPSVTWAPVDCTVAPDLPYLPRGAMDATRETVGDGDDFAAAVTGLISQTVGSFPSVTGVTQESDGSRNDYSIQLNSNFMTTAACDGIPGCLAWQQFVYSTSARSAFMQYWLIGYGACPSGAGWSSYESDCYMNSAAVAVPKVGIQSLANLKMSGSAVVDGNDTLVFTTETDAYSTSGDDSVTDLATSWTASEFNLIGDGDGSEATFNAGASVTVKIAVTDGTTAAPVCGANDGTTAETNNLTLGGCQAVGGSTPYIQFTESNVDAGVPSEDGGADVVGADVSADAAEEGSL
jgi:hypothetical protein